MIKIKVAVWALLIALAFGWLAPHTSVAAPPSFAKFGDKSERVRSIQYLLRAHGYKVQPDGSFGSETRRQILNFQRAHKLNTTGEVDSKTWPALMVTVRPGSRGDAVRAVQSKLRTLGYKVAVDGEFGMQTRQAVTYFQGNHGLTQDGIVGPQTWSELLKATGDEGSIEGSGGSLRPASGRSTGIRLLSEHVRFDIFDGEYEASATFDFHNPGPATTVTLAFPELITDLDSAYGAPGASVFERFAMQLGGRRVTARRVPLAVKEERQRHRANWQRSVPFRRGQRQTMRVQWRAKHTFNYLGVWVAYEFAGGQWAGEVAETSLTAAFHQPGTSYSIDAAVPSSGDRSLALRTNGNRCSYRWQGKAPGGLLALNFWPTVPGWLNDTEDGQAVTVPGKINWNSNSESSEYIWLPMAVLRDGRAFVSVEDMAMRILAPKPEDGRRGGSMEWSETAKAITLRAGNRSLRFERGQSRMQVDGQRWVSLPAAPFQLGADHPHDGPNTKLYVPLAPILKELGGTATVDAAQHYLDYEGPMFRKMPKDATDE